MIYKIKTSLGNFNHSYLDATVALLHETGQGLWSNKGILLFSSVPMMKVISNMRKA